MKNSINAIAEAYYDHPDYIDLSPKKASAEILKKAIPSDEFLCLQLNMSIEQELEQRILELRDEL